MKDASLKFKQIFLPFLAMSSGFVLIYTLLNYLLIIRYDIVQVGEDWVHFFLPMALPWVLILVWWRKRTRLLRKTGNNGRGDVRFGVQMIAWIAMATPTIVAQYYMEAATGKLTQLQDVGQLKDQKATRYYALQNFFIDKERPAIYSSHWLSGKHNEDLIFDVSVVMPIRKNTTDTVDTVVAWYAVHFGKSIDKHGSTEEKDKKWRAFLDDCQAKFDSLDPAQFVYLERIGLNNERERYVDALEKTGVHADAQTLILKPVNEPFEKRTGDMLMWIIIAYLAGSALVLLIVLASKLEPDAASSLGKGNAKEDDDVVDFLRMLLPGKLLFATPLIIDVNILVFVVMVCSGLGFVDFHTADLIKWGANYGPLTKQGEWWRLETCTFLHGGIMHLVANMYGFLFVGIFLEPVIGKGRFVAAYLATGIFASLASLWWHSGVVSVGASGAIFGMYGVFLALLLAGIFPKTVSKGFLISASVFVGYNLLAGMAGGIDNAAHIGGLLSGFVIGWMIKFLLPKDWEAYADKGQNDEETQ